MSVGNNNGAPRYSLSRFRRNVSQNSQNSSDQTFSQANDTTQNNSSTMRTVSSSSTSMLSTPSNNIRRNQQIRPQALHKETHAQKKDRAPVMLRSGNNMLKNKLLNLQSSKKYSRKDFDLAGSGAGFLSANSLVSGGYDYGVFVSANDGASGPEDKSMPPLVKQSQIKAWESAEKVSQKLIFDDSDTEEGEKESSPSEEIITSIPGYTNGELEVVVSRFRQAQQSGPSLKLLNDDEEKRLLWEHRKHQQANQEKLFAQQSSLSSKRKIQVQQKKEVLAKLFGHSNTLNSEYVTNNTTYSSIDNLSNSSKAFHEDKEEINALIEEDKTFHRSLQETKSFMRAYNESPLSSSFSKSKKIDIDDFDYNKFQNIIALKLSDIYMSYINSHENDSAPPEPEESDEMSNELFHFTTDFLRSCVREAEELDDSII
ncbi:Piso0_005591 [Millerozyma farinosa CBS 7064]|uniref:Piso0_005591 protein n=1 Tax=Pichia sorbitophila (strain ATCC MYA-4447 / BCRC 22081 / CBS 7064 / NBRC 10061 / NRRL Y-12695) TaxID=559304 RepID=G8Y2D8_PICSO|nr:Piso0_005591 [Millerozyma farinosa CBS 7064]